MMKRMIELIHNEKFRHNPPGQGFFAPQAKNYFEFFRQIGQEICDLVSILGKLLKKTNITYINLACGNTSAAVFV